MIGGENPLFSETFSNLRRLKIQRGFLFWLIWQAFLTTMREAGAQINGKEATQIELGES